MGDPVQPASSGRFAGVSVAWSGEPAAYTPPLASKVSKKDWPTVPTSSGVPAPGAMICNGGGGAAEPITMLPDSVVRVPVLSVTAIVTAGPVIRPALGQAANVTLPPIPVAGVFVPRCQGPQPGMAA
jgi:hypothetical protein